MGLTHAAKQSEVVLVFVPVQLVKLPGHLPVAFKRYARYQRASVHWLFALIARRYLRAVHVLPQASARDGRPVDDVPIHSSFSSRFEC
jgi:hypothetical protein